jgi:pimeloyl-ACP methyl ester carboxylesterase
MNTNSKFYLAALLILGILYSCSSAKTNEPATHKINFIAGSNNNKLELLDWGGNGQPILFLAGLGNSAHIFDEFAPRFTDNFQVYGLTRRGFGASVPANGYDLKTLTSDILAIMDSMGIQKAILVGHSIAGEELSKFAVLYPQRVNRIIYFDAAYDRIGMDSLMVDMPEMPKPTAEDSSSIQKFQNFSKAAYGIAMPTEEMRQVSIFSKEGRYIKDVTADSIIGAVMAGVEHPDYLKIQCPALAIYAQHDSVQQVFSFYNTLDTANKNKADRLFMNFEKLIIAQQARFEKEVKNGVAKKLMGANHYIFISHPVETEILMRDFLEL